MLLRNLSHAHIVAYKTSFVDKGELIIIMEFCESKPPFMLSLIPQPFSNVMRLLTQKYQGLC